METPKPHPHAELIKAWADGAEIQYFDGVKWRDEKHPSWDDDEKYRVRPDGEPWHPEYKDKYFIVDENFEPSEEVWDDCEFDDAQYERGNCFRTFEEAEAASERIKAALRGEESEEVKKLRKENEELKAEVAKSEEEASLQGMKADAFESVMSEGEKAMALAYGLVLSDGETALIKALRKAKVADTWESNSAVLVYETAGDMVSRKDIVAFVTDGTDADDDKVRKALYAISWEQAAEREARK